MKKVSRFSWRGLTPQLFAIIILPVIGLLLLVTFGGLSLHQYSMRTLVGQRDQRAARAAASTIEEQLRHRNMAMRGLALRATSNTSTEALTTILNETDYLIPDFEGGFAFLDPGGNLIAYSGDSTLWESLDPTTFDTLERSLTEETPTAVWASSHPITLEPLVYVLSPTKDNLIAIGAFYPKDLLQRSLAEVFSPDEGGSAFVIDSEGHLLYSRGNLIEGEDLNTHPGIEEALANKSGATYIQVGEKEHVVAYSPVSSANWALIIEEPWETVASPLLRVTEGAPLVLIPIVVVALLVVWFGTRRIVQPLQALESKAAELGWGNYAPIEEPVGGITEIRRLQSELIHLAHKVKVAQQGLRGYIGAITQGQEEERQRLARELHDDTLQALIALNQRVQLAQLSMNGNPKSSELAEIQDLTEHTIQNLRRITRALRPIYLEDLGLVAALEMLAQEIQQANDLIVDFHQSGREKRLGSNVELALYRIAQEALSNVIRHAQATQVAIHLSFSSQNLTLEISDNGIGFDVPESPAEFVPSGHYGLLGLSERAEMISAKLKIDSMPGRGTQVIVILPNTSIGPVGYLSDIDLNAPTN
ncbi:MAG: ATP-binding protein [Anaerolineales bacterium]|jgi:two-component system sensor histidine kinase UhpB|nr:ATP-binding protein [Anaerolineales bacterium]